MTGETPPLSSGQPILHFRLDEKLGEGGMGVVWRATDTTLDRAVAIKVLPAAFASDPERLARFEREARVLASLNHPNIATIYSVHLEGPVRFLSMELVPGEDLAQRIARGPIPVPEALEIARQIALALEAAHESGVVHRDLKPANVRVTPDGKVKVLDFGLAKALEASPAASALSQSPTYALSAMSTGMILGTAAYMSPEQARGQATDRRSDIWAFGVVLYEMLTGRRAFEGETVSDTLAAVLRAEPDRDALPASLPRPIRTLLDRCLEKNVRRRLRDIGEALIVIEDVQAGKVPAETAATPSPAPGRSRPSPLAIAVTAALILLAAAGGTLLRRPAPAPDLRKFTLTLDSGGGIFVTSTSISPDGRHLAYVRGNRLMVRDLAQTQSRILSEGLVENFRPAWSPGSDALVFAGGGELRRVDLASGAITPLCRVADFAGGSGATWMGDGTIVYAVGHDHLYKVPDAGGTSQVFLARIDSVDGDLHHPVALPGGRGVLFVRHTIREGPVILSVVSGGKRKDLLKLNSGFFWEPAYDPRGYVLFSRGGSDQSASGLWALPFSLDRLEVTGEPRLVVADGSSASVSNGGALVYRSGLESFTRIQVVTMTRNRAVVDTLISQQDYLWSMSLSPDGRMLAMDVRGNGVTGADADVWLMDLVRGTRTRFAYGPGRQITPCWSTDGRTIFFRDEMNAGIFAQPADGSAPARRITDGFWPRATPDGQHLLYARESGDSTAVNLWYGSVDGRDTVELLRAPGNQEFPIPAPNAPYLAYQSGENGTTEIYLKPYPTGEARWQVSTDGGQFPIWSRRGDDLYYWHNQQFMEVPVSFTPQPRLGNPHVLFDAPRDGLVSWGRFAILPTSNPDRFIVERALSHREAGAPDAVLVENWLAEFAKRK